MNFSPLFPSNFGEFSQNISTPTEQQQPLAQNSSGKTEYMAFPKPFESSSSIGAEKQRYLIVNIIHDILKYHFCDYILYTQFENTGRMLVIV